MGIPRKIPRPLSCALATVFVVRLLRPRYPHHKNLRGGFDDEISEPASLRRGCGRTDACGGVRAGGTRPSDTAQDRRTIAALGALRADRPAVPARLRYRRADARR